MAEYYINQASWEKIYSFLRSVPSLHTKNEARLRKFCEAIWYMANSGIRWRLLPKVYGHFRAVHKRFMSWANKNIWAELMSSVQDLPDLEAVMLDSTIVRAHVSAVGYKKDSSEQQSLGRSRGGFTTKIHTKVDALGNPLIFILTPGQRNDITQAQMLLGNTTDAIVIADKGYDSDAFVHFIEERGCTAVIPPRKKRLYPRTYDAHLYKDRHLIECFFGKIKQFRRIATRFDKSALAFLSFLYFVGTLMWLR
jgi:transposase